MHIHYTTYDITKASDYIAADKHANVNHEINAHRNLKMYAYARVFVLFHLYVLIGSQEAETLQGAWIQCCAVVWQTRIVGVDDLPETSTQYVQNTTHYLAPLMHRKSSGDAI